MMIDETRLTELLGEFHSKWGYAAGMEKVPGFIPGAKTFPPFERTVPEGKVSIVDTYFGKRGSGGMAVVSLNDKPFLLIQYHGGEMPSVPDKEVGEINDFLKEVLRNAPGTRLPGVRIPKHIRYQNDRYVYYGLGRGNAWNFLWLEVICRVGQSALLSHKMIYEAERFFEEVSSNNPQLLGAGDAIFYHILTHQRLQ